MHIDSLQHRSKLKLQVTCLHNKPLQGVSINIF